MVGRPPGRHEQRGEDDRLGVQQRRARTAPSPRRTGHRQCGHDPPPHRRFSDFAAYLTIPRAVLAHRLTALVEAGVLTVVPGSHGHDEYEMTAKGLDLWPVVRSLMAWGDGYYSAKGPRRLFSHAADGGEVPVDGTCATCGAAVAAADLVVVPGPGWQATGKTDAVSAALAGPHRLLTSVRSLLDRGPRASPSAPEVSFHSRVALACSPRRTPRRPTGPGPIPARGLSRAVSSRPVPGGLRRAARRCSRPARWKEPGWRWWAASPVPRQAGPGRAGLPCGLPVPA